MPESVPPTVEEGGEEKHPAWALIGASRVSTSPPGAALFDSDIRHQHYVVVRIRRASRDRHLNRDWLHGREEIIEVAMSEAQWASFVSSMNTGDGVPATITRFDGPVPGVIHEPRLAESMDEVRDAGKKALAHIEEAFKKVEEKPTKANIKSLRHAIENAPSNMRFAAESLTEHAENVVQRARADIEAMVLSKAEHLGIDPAEAGRLELGGGEDA